MIKILFDNANQRLLSVIEAAFLLRLFRITKFISSISVIFAPALTSVLFSARNIILSVIDFFYKPFSGFLDKQTYRYLACGGSNTILDLLVFYISYNFILQKKPVHLGGVDLIAPHIAAFLISFSISFPLGFALSKYVVFTESNLRGRVQLMRYAILVCMCILLNYFFLKIFVEWCHFYATPSKALTTAIVAIFSYVSQRNFTFKVKEVYIEEGSENTG